MSRALLCALFLVALNLRAALASLPPFTDTIAADTGLSSLGIGLLTTIPVLCLGAIAPIAPRIARRIGPERAVAAGLGVLSAGLTLRYLGEELAALFAGTALAGVGIALVGAVIPGIVRARFPERGGAVTGLYATAMALGATVAAGVAVPLQTALGSWRASLAVWAGVALIALIVWSPIASQARPGTATTGAAPRLPWRDPTAWLVTAYLAIQSLLFFSQLAWIAPAYVHEGWDKGEAGWLMSAYGAGGIAATLVVPMLSDRLRDRRRLLVMAVSLAVSGLAVLIVAPGWAPWATVTVLGFGQTAAFALGLVLLVSHAASPAAVAALTGMVFTVAYSIAAAGPALFGLLRDATGAFTAPLTAMAVIDITAILIAVALHPDRRVHAPRHAVPPSTSPLVTGDPAR